jgi:predicted nucleic acid-binding protein
LARRRREGQLQSDEEDAALAVVATLQASWYEIEPSEQLRDHTARLIRTHSLRASDALQLAAALVWIEDATPGEFVTLDHRLDAAARLEGFKVLP